MTTKICILFGGKSIEHEVSILSTKNLLPFFDRENYEITLFGIDRDGMWHLSDENCEMKAPMPFYQAFAEMERREIEVVFPILHGVNGEDGTIQGLLDVANIPNVGPSVLSASVALDKDVMKRLVRDAGIPQTDFAVYTELPDYELVKQKVGLPIYIKPATGGSTLGISIAYSEEEFARGFAFAKKFDHKVICERKVVGREIECSVIGLDNPVASLPAEIVPKSETYSYVGKYFDRSLTKYIYPAQLDPELMHYIQELSIQVYKLMCSEIMARLDFFLDEEGNVLFNEINTIPGFTYMSMFHRMWEVSDLPTTKLIDRLVDYALERHQRKQTLEYTSSETVLA